MNYALCDPTGYVFAFFVKCDPRWKRDWFGLKPTFSVIVELAKEIPGDEKWHHIFVDNLYGNVNLAACLLHLNFAFTSTLRKNRVPPALKLPLHATQGQVIRLSRHDGVMVVIWRDKRM